MSTTNLLDLTADAIGAVFSKISDKESRKAFMGTCRSIHQNQACLSQLQTLRLRVPDKSAAYEAYEAFCAKEIAKQKEMEEKGVPLPVPEDVAPEDDQPGPQKEPSLEECVESVRQQLETVPRGAAIRELQIKGHSYNPDSNPSRGIRAIRDALSSNQGPRQLQLQHQITFLNTIASQKVSRLEPYEDLKETVEAMLEHLPNVKALKLEGPTLNLDLLLALQARCLESLILEVDDQCWWPEHYSILAGLTSLSFLELSVINHSNVMGLSALAPLTGLTSLQLKGPWVAAYTEHSLYGRPRSETQLPSDCGGTDQYCGAPALLGACRKLRSARFDTLPLDMSSIGSLQHIALNTASVGDLSAILADSAGLQSLHVNHLKLRKMDGGVRLAGVLQALQRLPASFSCDVLWLQSSAGPARYEPCGKMLALLSELLPLLPSFNVVVLHNLHFAASQLSGLCAMLNTRSNVKLLHLLCCSLVPESLTEAVSSLPHLNTLEVSTGKYGLLELPDFLPSSLVQACAMSPTLKACLYIHTTGKEEYDAMDRYRGGTKGPRDGPVSELRKSRRMFMVVWGRDGLHMGVNANMKTHVFVGE